MTNIKLQIDEVREKIVQACELVNRDPAGVNLLAVTKTMGIEKVINAVEAGQKDFGENYLQEALPKIAKLPSASWHFIGAIQSNKTREIANAFNWVHGIATEKVARRLSEQRDPKLGKLNCLIQVNLSDEKQKSGVNSNDALRLAGQFEAFDRIALRGLMTIPASITSEAKRIDTFRCLRELKDEIQQRHGLEEFDHLSMGMTNDFVTAIKEGATWIRIGTAIFGQRDLT